MTTDQTPSQPEDTEKPRRTLAEAALELRGLLAAQRARARNGDLARELARLQQQVDRRRAAVEKAGLTDD